MIDRACRVIVVACVILIVGTWILTVVGIEI